MLKLPFKINFNTVEVLTALNEANYYIGVMNGLLSAIPNPDLILSIITLRESKDSSAIENIMTTYDQLFTEMISSTVNHNPSKEVLNYRKALSVGVSILKAKGFLNMNSLIDIHAEIVGFRAGIRKLPGTVIKNMVTGEILHTPPQHESDIIRYLTNLETYINESNEYDPLVAMAIIHAQFEMIHPFYDGNGRLGRVLNVLYLIMKGKVKHPILYLSSYINETKEKYYHLLKMCNEDETNILSFVLYILKGIKQTAVMTIDLIQTINMTLNVSDIEMKKRLPNIYRYEIVKHIFSFLYTKNEVFRNDLNISRNTATKYLKELEREGFLVSKSVGQEVIYRNVQLYNLIDGE